MRPSAATRPALLAAAAKPFFLSQSTADSISPPVSPSARLQSIIPAPVFSRSSLTSAAVTSAICVKLPFKLRRPPPFPFRSVVRYQVRLRLQPRRGPPRGDPQEG